MPLIPSWALLHMLWAIIGSISSSCSITRLGCWRPIDLSETQSGRWNKCRSSTYNSSSNIHSTVRATINSVINTTKRNDDRFRAVLSLQPPLPCPRLPAGHSGRSFCCRVERDRVARLLTFIAVELYTWAATAAAVISLFCAAALRCRGSVVVGARPVPQRQHFQMPLWPR